MLKMYPRKSKVCEGLRYGIPFEFQNCCAIKFGLRMKTFLVGETFVCSSMLMLFYVRKWLCVFTCVCVLLASLKFEVDDHINVEVQRSNTRRLRQNEPMVLLTRRKTVFFFHLIGCSIVICVL